MKVGVGPPNDFDRALEQLEAVETVDLTGKGSVSQIHREPEKLLDNGSPSLKGNQGGEEARDESDRGRSSTTDVHHINGDREHKPSIGVQKRKRTPLQRDGSLHRHRSTSTASLSSESLFALDSSDSESEDRYVDMNAPSRQHPPPPPVLVDRNGVKSKEWCVDEIINSKIVRMGGRMQLRYLVNWTGYDEPSWEPLCNLIPGSELLVVNFHKKYPNRPLPASVHVLLNSHQPSKQHGRPPSGKRHKRACFGI
ncbi:hypothetical protein AJ80_08403 [Polytolypa hystricis UAMH7299]|uniref:Chromo domain-containing protein n=1 Tax=Polytolypa hystricis (strain UAMH7299) TaxID=1447883 RepID=A0A2B7X0H2_POLH7|nr:hypothetical protein AJ80_08403 [Polytolypa hystricis UAMH7299]